MTRKLRSRIRITRNTGDIAPKVAASTGGSALGVVLAWVLTEVPVIDHAPPEVQAALALLLISALTFAGGYLKHDSVP